MRKIIIISHDPLTINLKRLFFIEEFFNLRLTLEYWDISKIIRKGIKLADELEESYIKKILSIDDFEYHLLKEDISRCIFVVEISKNWDNRFFYKLLSDFKCEIWGIDQYANTSLALTKKDYLFKLLNLKELYPKLKNKYYSHKLKQFNAEFKVKSYDKFFTSSSLDSRATDHINHPDYDLFNHSISLVDIPSRPFILFIDNYFPLHPDFEFFYKKKLMGAEEYQKSLCDFFDFLEKKYHMPVIIAAHPKSDYNINTFNKREIIKYDTVNLVIKSSFVILHASNSISYILLANKPLLMITTDGYNRVSFLTLRLRQLARELGVSIFNIDCDDYNKCSFKQINSQLREKYIYTYLTKPEIESKKTIDIIMHAINTSD